MIICPLNLEECSKSILPIPKTAFVMAPSEEKKSLECKKILRRIYSALSRYDLRRLEGSKIEKYGDYFCSICKTLLGCTFGVAIVEEAMPIDTLGNIYVEMGLMQGFGKPVVLFADKRGSVPSDFSRNFVIIFNRKNYISKFEGILQEFIIERENYYSVHLGDYAFKKGDYEKACKYYQEAYLFKANPEILDKISALISKLETAQGIPKGYKMRLLDNASTFHKEATLQKESDLPPKNRSR